MSLSETADRISFGDVLDLLGYEIDGGEFLAIGYRPVGRGFCSVVRTPEDAIRFVFEYLLGPYSEFDCDVYFSINPVAGPARNDGGRGQERDVTRWNALYGDFDVKAGAFKKIDDILACITTISAMLGTRPSVLIFSGHGVQALWVIEDGVLDTEAKWEAAARLSRRFGRLVATVAWRDHHAGMDSVFDLSRMLRVSDTFNVKDPRHIVMAYALADTGGPLTVERIEEALDEWGETLGVPELDSDRPVRGEVISPPSDWRFATADCNYVTAMVSRWGQESDRPKAGRHQWAMDRCVRLACAYRWGCLTEDGLKAALAHLEKALGHWCQVVGHPRGLHRNEINDAWKWGVTKVATLTDEQVRGQLAGHTHYGYDPFGRRRTVLRTSLPRTAKYAFRQGVS